MQKRQLSQKWFYSSLLFFFAVFAFFSCRKMDSLSIPMRNEEIAAKFLTLPSSATPQIRRIAQKLKTLDEKHGFLNTIAKRDGFAVWDKAIFKTNSSMQRTASESANSNDTIIYIPLVLENANYVNAFI